jgi:CheY-like chemotaxis protein
MERPNDSPGLRVLVVDDCPDTTWSMALLLRLWGYTVATAGDGLAALALAEQFHPDVILLDIGLPRLSGHEVARRLRQMPGLGPLQIIGISGFGRPEDCQKALQAGCDHYLVKPVELDMMQGLLASLLARRPAEPASPACQNHP